MERKQRPRSGKTAAKETHTPSQPPRSDRTVTIHPRVSLEEGQIIKDVAEQTNLPETTIWGECASVGLLIILIKKGPNSLGLYGGRWSAKELAQEIRRRILNELVDFQYEQGELPALLRDYMATLKTLAEQRQQGIIFAPSAPIQQQEVIPPTEEDQLIFSIQGTDAESVNQSLGGMGFKLNLGELGNEEE